MPANTAFSETTDFLKATEIRHNKLSRGKSKQN